MTFEPAQRDPREAQTTSFPTPHSRSAGNGPTGQGGASTTATAAPTAPSSAPPANPASRAADGWPQGAAQEPTDPGAANPAEQAGPRTAANAVPSPGGGVVPPAGPVPPGSAGYPAAPGGKPAKPQRNLSAGIAAVLAACALVVGGAAGFVIGHSTSSGSDTPTMGQMPGGGMGGYLGGYGPGGGMGGPPGMQQQGSSDSTQQQSTT